jgi:capsular polysaccharide transport system permease protein
MHPILVQIQVIHALVLRETRTRFGLNRLGYLWAILEPLLFIGTFVLIFRVLGRAAPDRMPIIPFLATGFMPYLLFRETSGRGLHAIEANRGLLFYPQVRPLDLVLARTLLEIVTNFVAFAIIIAIYSTYTGQFEIANPLRVLTGLGLAAGIGATLGLILCAAGVFSDFVERLHGPLIRPLFWFSGLMYPTSHLPLTYRNLLVYNPIVHAVELTRAGYFRGYRADHVGVGYPLMCITVLAFVGLTLERVARRHLVLS